MSRKNKHQILFFFYFLAFIGFPSARASTPLDIDTFDILKIGESREQVVKLLGPPSKKSILGEGDLKAEVWSYTQPTMSEGKQYIFDRIALVFDMKNPGLFSKNFFPAEGEPEMKIANVKARYKSAKLTFKEAAFCGRYQRRNQYYIDAKAGLRISEAATRQEVEAINWYEPSARQPASEIGNCNNSSL